MEIPEEVKALFAQMPDSELLNVRVVNEAGLNDVTLMRFLQGNSPLAREYRSTGEWTLKINCKLRFKK